MRSASTGELGDAKGAPAHATVMIFYRNRRRFELRCFATHHESGTPCDNALQELVIDEMPDAPEPTDRPHVLHLREDKYRIQFDAPDDSWLAIGPRIGGGGKQIVWIWNKEGRQLDVQVLDLANVGTKIDEATFVEMMADSHRKPGTTVTVKRSELSGFPKSCCRAMTEPQRSKVTVEQLRIRLISETDAPVLAAFTCGEPDLDDFVRTDALRLQAHRVVRTYLAFLDRELVVRHWTNATPTPSVTTPNVTASPALTPQAPSRRKVARRLRPLRKRLDDDRAEPQAEVGCQSRRNRNTDPSPPAATMSARSFTARTCNDEATGPFFTKSARFRRTPGEGTR
jgi:hypothetical protein